MADERDPCSQEIHELKVQVNHIEDEVNQVRERLHNLESRHSKCLVGEEAEKAISVTGAGSGDRGGSLPPEHPGLVVHALIAERELCPYTPPPAVPPKPSQPAAATVSPTARAFVTAEFNGPAGVLVEHAVEETPNLQAASTVSGQIAPTGPAASRMHVTETTTETTTENGTTITKKVYVTERLVSGLIESKLQNVFQNGDGGKAVRFIGLQKRPGDDHLVSTAYCARVSHTSSDPVIAFLQGLTVRQDNGQLVIARILDDCPLAKQGIVHVGDTILEVNGVEVTTPEDLQKQLKGAEAVSLKIVPSGLEVAPPINGAYIRCFYDYDPTKDDRIQRKEIGLPFKVGDILQVISKDDPNWWQARKVNDWSKTGIIPSQTFEEKRRAAKAAQLAKSGTKATAGGSSTDGVAGLANLHKSKRVMYSVKNSADFDHHDMLIYEEVGRLSPYGRRVLVLLGAPGVGRRTLKAHLLQHDGDNFATITPFTSRKRREGEVDGREYHFAPRDKLHQEIDRGEFLEWGEFNGNYYGTKLESVRQIVRSGRLCVLDCSPQALKYLYNREFMPYVVFLAPPPIEEFKQLYQIHPNRTKPRTDEDLSRTCEESARLEAAYKHYFDLVLVNRNAEVTFRRLIDALESLKTLHQWVPVTWIYG